MGPDFDLLLDLRMGAFFPAVGQLRTLLGKPLCCEADKVGGKERSLFLKQERWWGAHLEMPYFKDPFPLFVAGLDRLAGIVVMEPLWQVGGNIILAEVQQGGCPHLVAGVEVLQCHIEWVREICQLCGGPGEHLGIVADALPLALRCDPSLQPGHEPRAKRLAIDFVPQFDTQGDVLRRLKSGIKPQTGHQGGRVGRIVCGEPLQPLRQTGDFSVLGAQSGLAPGQPGRSSGDCAFMPTLAALIDPQLGFGLGQLAMRTFGPISFRIERLQGLHLLLTSSHPLLHLSQRRLGLAETGLRCCDFRGPLDTRRLQRADALGQQVGSAPRSAPDAPFGGQHQRFGLRARDGVARMLGDRQAQAPIRDARHGNDRRLIAQTDVVAHVSKCSPRVSAAGIRDGARREIGIQFQPASRPRRDDFLVNQRLTDAFQGQHNALGFGG